MYCFYVFLKFSTSVENINFRAYLKTFIKTPLKSFKDNPGFKIHKSKTNTKNQNQNQNQKIKIKKSKNQNQKTKNKKTKNI